MTIHNPDPELRRYLTDRGLSQLVAAGFMRSKTPELIEDTFAHLNAYLLTIILSQSGLAVSFIASDVLAGAMYLKGIIIAPEFQGYGLGNALVKGNMDVLGAKNLGLHTQNANMDGVANRNAIYMHNEAKVKAPLFGTESPVVKNIGGRPRVVHEAKYGGESLYGDMNRYLQQNMAPSGLDYQAGDALFFYGKRQK